MKNSWYSPAAVLYVGTCLLLLGCAGGDLTPFDPSQQSGMALHEDEKRIWGQSREEQLQLDRSGHLYDNSEITDYVNRVAQGLMPHQPEQSVLQVQVKIVRSPLLNAFAFPHGVIYVHTGILARMDNEAQLATLLGHELTHSTHRHAVQSIRTIKNTSATLAGLGVVLLPFGYFGNLVAVLGQIGGMAAVTGYSRSLESEADRVGLERMVAAGYDPHESPKLFEYLKRDLEEQKLDEPFFFGTHPKLVDRIEEFQEQVKDRYAARSGITNAEAFMTVMQPLFLENAKMDLAIGRFQSAESGLTRYLARYPQDASAHYWLGEVYRQRGEEADRDKAVQAFEKAIQVTPGFADPYRSLGTMWFKQEQWKEAQSAFEQYLALSPAAADRAFIETYVEQLRKK
ncbi:MAG: M48 family metalloprotease [Nitrospirales bacterium]